jgi:hypothetical protein
LAVRRLVAWLIALPLTAAGIWTRHALLPMETGHVGHDHGASASTPGSELGLSFFCSIPFVLSTLALLALLGLVGIVQERRLLTVSAWPFAVLVPVGFALHFHLEHAAGAGGPFGLIVESAFLVGLGIQLPFAMVAYLIATALLHVAERIGEAFAARRRRQRLRPVSRKTPPRWACLARPRPALLATAGAPRAPPLAA